MGSLVGVGGLALGTGAFSFAQTDRDITVEVKNDREAQLVLDPRQPLSRSSFDSDSGVVKFSITGQDSDADGINPNSVTRFDGEAGTNDGLLGVGNESPETIEFFTRRPTEDDDRPVALFYDLDEGVLLDGENGGTKTLEPGDFFNAGLWIDARGVESRDELYTVAVTIVGESESN